MTYQSQIGVEDTHILRKHILANHKQELPFTNNEKTDRLLANQRSSNFPRCHCYSRKIDTGGQSLNINEKYVRLAESPS